MACHAHALGATWRAHGRVRLRGCGPWATTLVHGGAAAPGAMAVAMHAGGWLHLRLHERAPTFEVQMTSRKWMFIHESHSTMCPL